MGFFEEKQLLVDLKQEIVFPREWTLYDLEVAYKFVHLQTLSNSAQNTVKVVLITKEIGTAERNGDGLQDYILQCSCWVITLVVMVYCR